MIKGKAALKALLSSGAMQRHMRPSTRRTVVLAINLSIGFAVIALYLLRGRPLF